METEDLLHVTKKEVALAIEVDRDQWLHLRVQHLVLIALKSMQTFIKLTSQYRKCVITFELLW